MNDITVRKFNAIKKACCLPPTTFEDVFSFVESNINLAEYTAKQIAEIMDLCYEQHTLGFLSGCEEAE